MATKSKNIFQEGNLDAAKRKYVKAKKAYYGNNPGERLPMTDAEFNVLENQIRRLHPDWSELKKTGVKVANKKIEVPLEEYMPSLNKMYEEDVPKFYARASSKKVTFWIDMDKLDGTSLQLIYYKGEPVRLITRGDGTNGGDISFFIPWLVKLGRIPEKISLRNRVVFRVEGVMQKKVFAKHWASKYDTARNLVNGIFNKQAQHEALKHVDMVVLGVYGMTLSAGLMAAMENGHHVVDHVVTKKAFTAEEHKKFLEQRRKESLFDMDGTVRGPANWVMEYANANKPKAVIAFKVNDEATAFQVDALEEIWAKTRLNRWSCKIRIKPTVMDGVTVEYVTAHNPGWMKEKGVGKGAVLKVLRSGGVIPKIVGVVKKAKFQGPPGRYELRGRFFYAMEEDAASDVQKIHHFMTTLGIELLAGKTIEKLHSVGLMTPADYIRTVQGGSAARTITLFEKAGLGKVQSSKIYNELNRVLSDVVSMKKLMVASGCFENGIGERKLSMLEAAEISMVDLYTGKRERLAGTILKVKGFSNKTTEATLNGLDEFKTWFAPLQNLLRTDGTLPSIKVKAIKGPLSGLKIAFTGYRDAHQESMVGKNGGEVASFSGKTDVLLYKAGGKPSSKVEKAGSKAMTWEDFAKKYRVVEF